MDSTGFLARGSGGIIRSSQLIQAARLRFEFTQADQYDALEYHTMTLESKSISEPHYMAYIVTWGRGPLLCMACTSPFSAKLNNTSSYIKYKQHLCCQSLLISCVFWEICHNGRNKISVIIRILERLGQFKNQGVTVRSKRNRPLMVQIFDQLWNAVIIIRVSNDELVQKVMWHNQVFCAFYILYLAINAKTYMK